MCVRSQLPYKRIHCAHSIHRHMENTFELVGHRHVMLREHTLEIISLMKGAFVCVERESERACADPLWRPCCRLGEPEDG